MVLVLQYGDDTRLGAYRIFYMHKWIFRKTQSFRCPQVRHGAPQVNVFLEFCHIFIFYFFGILVYYIFLLGAY